MNTFSVMSSVRNCTLNSVITVTNLILGVGLFTGEVDGYHFGFSVFRLCWFGAGEVGGV